MVDLFRVAESLGAAPCDLLLNSGHFVCASHCAAGIIRRNHAVVVLTSSSMDRGQAEEVRQHQKVKVIIFSLLTSGECFSAALLAIFELGDIDFIVGIHYVHIDPCQ